MTVASRALLIAGPTASGKSALALHLAQALNGEIINADSMQLYRGLRILTARPDPAEEALVGHHLYGVAEPDDPWSVGRWLEAAAGVMAQLHGAGKTAIFVGGTGLYFSALEHGLNDIPDVPEEVRNGLRQRLEEEGLPALRSELESRDPALAARIEPGDRQRTLRALEVVAATGRPLSSWQDDEVSTPLLDAVKVGRILLMPDRAALYARCDTRFDEMLKSGMLDEVAALKARGLDPGLPAMKALGVPQLIRHLEGACTQDEAVIAAKTETRRYAKRQMTWFRNRMADWPVHQDIDRRQIADTLAGELEWPVDFPA